MKKWIVQKDNEKCRDCGKELSQGSYVWLNEETEEIVCQECFFTEEEAGMLD